MQFMPQMPPSAYILDGSDAEMSRLTKRARTHVEAAVMSGDVVVDKPIIIVVDGEKVTVSNHVDLGLGASVEDAMSTAGISASLDEINSLLNDGLPEMYTRDDVSQSEDKLYASHLNDHWGF